MPKALNFAGLNQHLYDQKADVIFLCLGLNEAFKRLFKFLFHELCET